MKISFNWLKSYLPTALSAAEVAAILTDTGLEVEKVEHFDPAAGGLENVVVGHVLTVVPHPNADKLKLTTVDVAGSEPLQIVCGAPNVAVGQKVLVALVGAKLQPTEGEPFEIKKSKIRGELSLGMICAEDELGLGESHEGIMVLPKDAIAGTPAGDFLQVEQDDVFEIGLTPNRTDGFGHFGVARDLAARLSHNEGHAVRAQLPEVPKFAEKAQGRIQVHIEDTDGCGRYAGLELDNVQVAPSPEWLQNRLRAVGLKPINNVVDITNFVMLETGQPLHAFDAAKIKGGKILVRTQPEGTEFITLDGTKRKLGADDLMICNTEVGMCMAGVFGGIDSGVGAATKGVFLESAWFNPVRVRKTAKRHALNTDSSFRFERGVDPQGTLYALRRAAALISEIAGGKPAGTLIDLEVNTPKPVQLDFSLEYCNRLCGTHISEDELEGILASLDFAVSKHKAQGQYTLTVPTYRADVTRPVDVVEEVLRIYGFNAVPMPDRMRISVSLPQKPVREEVINTLAQSLTGRGFLEMMSNGLTRSDRLLAVGGEDLGQGLVAMLNPLSQELDVLRPHLYNSALETVAYNLNRQAERLQLFEIGKAYRQAADGYAEAHNLCLALCGNRFQENWNNTQTPFDGSDLRGHLTAALEVMGLSDHVRFEPTQHAFLTKAVSIKLRDKEIGSLGAASKAAMKAYGVKREVWLAEISLDACLKKVRHAAQSYAPLPRFPAVRRDFSLLLDESVPFSAVEALAYKCAGKLLKEVGLFDVYEGKNLPAGKKSYAVRFMLQDPNRTLQDKEIDKRMGDIQHSLESELGAVLR
jgi:phenylalanyl-tRNA synthetase beta chain